MSALTKKAGVMGWPVSHSLSPALHGWWLEQYGIDGSYVPLPVRPEEIESALRALPERGFRGVNLTLPHKETAYRLVDRHDDTAAACGAVNTVVVEADGSLTGTNTDVFGFTEHLRAETGRADFGVAMVIGAGGAARAILHALLREGTQKILLLNRTQGKAQALAEMDSRIETLPWAARHDALASVDLLVNTTSQGMRGQPPLELKLDAVPATAIVYDIVYTPLETPLLAAARARGNHAIDGLGMLLHQACPGFAAWFGREPEVTPALRAHVLSLGAGA